MEQMINNNDIAAKIDRSINELTGVKMEIGKMSQEYELLRKKY